MLIGDFWVSQVRTFEEKHFTSLFTNFSDFDQGDVKSLNPGGSLYTEVFF